MASTLVMTQVTEAMSVTAPRLAEGTLLLGPYKDSGCVKPPSIIRLGDGRMLEVSPLLHQLASNLDGEPDLKVVAARLSADLGRPISRDSVRYLIDNKLRPLGLLADPNPAGLPPRSTPALLGLTLHAGVIPAPVVRAVTTLLRPLFRVPVVLVVLAGFLVADVGLLLGHGLAQGFNDVLADPALLLLVVSLTLLGGVLHELGHATASRYGGAEPGEIGAGIYLIWPVFYNDLNDSHRLGRADRLRCDLGGVYFNAMFILTLLGLYSVTELEPLLVVAAIQHLVILQQFLPFVRLDGYYVVSDIAGVPDLFARIRPIMSSLLPGRPAGTAVAELKPGARWIVTAWVLISVPLLAAGLVLLVIRLPSLVKLTAGSIVTQAGMLVGAAQAGAVITAALSGVHILLLAVPVVGLSVMLLRALTRCRRIQFHHRLGRAILAFGAP